MSTSVIDAIFVPSETPPNELATSMPTAKSEVSVVPSLEASTVVSVLSTSASSMTNPPVKSQSTNKFHSPSAIFSSASS